MQWCSPGNEAILHLGTCSRALLPHWVETTNTKQRCSVHSMCSNWNRWIGILKNFYHVADIAEHTHMRTYTHTHTHIHTCTHAQQKPTWFSSVHFDLITQEILHLQLIGGFMQVLGPISGRWWWHLCWTRLSYHKWHCSNLFFWKGEGQIPFYKVYHPSTENPKALVGFELRTEPELGTADSHSASTPPPPILGYYSCMTILPMLIQRMQYV